MAHTDLDKWRLFSDLSAAEADVIVNACEGRMLLAGEDLFLEGEEGDSLWIIESGRVDIYKNIRGDIDRTLASLGPGDVIGEMSFIDRSRRSAGVRTAEASEFLVLSREAFQRVEGERPEIAARFNHNLAAILAARLRSMNEMYRDTVAFTIEATGAAALNLRSLSDELRPVMFHLSGGTDVSGRVLQMDHSPAGYTVVVKQNSGTISIIPYHAIQRIELV